MNNRPIRLWSVVVNHPNGVGSSTGTPRDVVAVLFSLIVSCWSVPQELGWRFDPKIDRARKRGGSRAGVERALYSPDCQSRNSKAGFYQGLFGATLGQGTSANGLKDQHVDSDSNKQRPQVDD